MEHEAKDTSELVDEDITRARRVEAKVWVEDRRREFEQQSRRCSNRFRKHCEYQTEPDEFMTRVKARSEQQRAWDEDGEVLRKVAHGAEPSVDGLLSWKTHTDPATSTPENVSNQYAEALELWPSPLKVKSKKVRFEMPSDLKNSKLSSSKPESDVLEEHLERTQEGRKSCKNMQLADNEGYGHAKAKLQG